MLGCARLFASTDNILVRGDPLQKVLATNHMDGVVSLNVPDEAMLHGKAVCC